MRRKWLAVRPSGRSDAATEGRGKESEVAPRPPRGAVFCLVMLIIISVGVGCWIYSRQAGMQERHVNEAMFRAAQVRASRISTTIHERIGDAKLVSMTPFLRDAFGLWQRDGSMNDERKRKIREYLNALRDTYDYVTVSIVGKNGQILIAGENIAPRVDSYAAGTVKNAFASKRIRISSMDPSRLEGKHRLIDIAAPIMAVGDARRNVAAVLLLQFDAEEHIYPALQLSPFPSLPNDALLVEVRQGKVISLSEFNTEPYRLFDVLPITPKQLRESAVHPELSPFVWKPANGSRQIAAAYPVDVLPWFVITMVPVSAADAVVRDTALAAMFISMIMLMILGLVVRYWWKFRESELKFIAMQTESQRRLMQQQYEYLSQYANDMIILADGDYRILGANEKTVHVFGYQASWMIGNPVYMLSPQSDHERLKENLDKLRSQRTAIFEILQKKRDGTEFPVEVSARIIDLEEGSFSQFICRDITERKEAEKRIHSLAYYDNVTGLPNRALLNDRLERATHMAARSQKKVGILFMDLDNFKNINDSLGHQIGDELLLAVGQRLTDSVREGDTVARIGGDEFLVMLPDLEVGEEAHYVAEKVIASFSRPFLLQAHQLYISTSIGISIFPDDAKGSAELIKYADSALYEAKGHGRNNYQFFTQKLNEEITRASNMENYLRQAMENGELRLWYQPQVDARNGKIIGAEALLRVREGSFERFAPSAFVTMAEERGLIIKLGEWTLREACRQCHLWQMQGVKTVPISVNVSAIQLKQKEFSDGVFRILSEFGVDASCLELEITETAIMGRAEDVAGLAVRFRESGIRMSIDDFGTGYSNLSYLKHIPIDKIKIDRTFILDMLTDAEDETITQAIINMAQGLNIRVIAEGVEHEAQMKRLISFGCHEAQGFLYSEAVSPETFLAYLEKGGYLEALPPDSSAVRLQ